MSFELPPLPYSKDALIPHISPETVDFHYEKHHRGYVNRLNLFSKDDQTLPTKSYEELIRTNYGGPRIFNMAAQVWNHTFYWNSLSPNGGGEPKGKIAQLITSSFGNFETFKTKFSEAAAGHFGSGWAWLVQNADGSLEVLGTHDAGCPITDGKKPILTCDVWEHAYYIDYRNDRARYVASWWNLINWEFANSNLA
eukprot:TRINITY_DN675_c0_g1_i1.p1 TRINITY_DN675_c0_g1~~TRINITY_DN675_c0_g1_i1.p1  ORF type:complete len:196 (-),score=90.53 TRINITY_DN675_c0_g1_i1:47-634(-)